MNSTTGTWTFGPYRASEPTVELCRDERYVVIVQGTGVLGTITVESTRGDLIASRIAGPERKNRWVFCNANVITEELLEFVVFYGDHIHYGDQLADQILENI